MVMEGRLPTGVMVRFDIGMAVFVVRWHGMVDSTLQLRST